MRSWHYLNNLAVLLIYMPLKHRLCTLGYIYRINSPKEYGYKLHTFSNSSTVVYLIWKCSCEMGKLILDKYLGWWVKWKMHLDTSMLLFEPRLMGCQYAKVSIPTFLSNIEFTPLHWQNVWNFGSYFWTKWKYKFWTYFRKRCKFWSYFLKKCKFRLYLD